MKISIQELRDIVKNSITELTPRNKKNFNRYATVEKEIQLPDGDIMYVQFYGNVKTEKNSKEDEGLPLENTFIDGEILWDSELNTPEENEAIKQSLTNPRVYSEIENALIDNKPEYGDDFDYGEYQLNKLD